MGWSKGRILGIECGQRFPCRRSGEALNSLAIPYFLFRSSWWDEMGMRAGKKQSNGAMTFLWHLPGLKTPWDAYYVVSSWQKDPCGRENQHNMNWNHHEIIRDICILRFYIYSTLLATVHVLPPFSNICIIMIIYNYVYIYDGMFRFEQGRPTLTFRCTPRGYGYLR